MTDISYLRIRDIASYPATEPHVYICKSGVHKGATRTISGRPASQGLLNVTANTIWRWVRDGFFPKPLKLSEGVTVWSKEEVIAWVQSKGENCTEVNREQLEQVSGATA